MKLLVKIQQELSVPKSQHNKFGNFNYRSCEDILEAVKPYLKDGATLTLNDEVKSIGDVLYVEATAKLTHNSESVSVSAQAGINTMRKGMDVAQSFGASSSYARKYALGGLFLLDDSKDADSRDNTDQNQPPTPDRVKEMLTSLDESTTKADLEKIFKSFSPVERKEVRAYAKEKAESFSR